jgi:hypothetical protein
VITKQLNDHSSNSSRIRTPERKELYTVVVKQELTNIFLLPIFRRFANVSFIGAPHWSGVAALAWKSEPSVCILEELLD